MDEQIGELLLGPSGGEVVLHKDIDWTKPFRWFALAFLIAWMFNYFGSILMEEYRMSTMYEEVNNIVQMAAVSAESRLQAVLPQDCMFEDGALSNDYVEYLNELWEHANDSADADLGAIAAMLSDFSGSSIYTPLNFNLTYLNKNLLSQYFNEDMTMISNAVLDTDFGEVDMNSWKEGSALEEILLGSGRYRISSTQMEVQAMRSFDITNIASAPDETQDIYANVYGSLDPEAAVLGKEGLTDKHHLIVYNVKYTVKWVPYTGTPFFHRPDNSRLTTQWIKDNTDRNRNGFVAYPEQTTTLERLYFTTN